TGAAQGPEPGPLEPPAHRPGRHRPRPRRGPVGRGTGPLRPPGGHRRLPRPRPPLRGDRLGPHRHPLRAAGRPHTVPGRRTQPRGRRVHGRGARRRAAPRRRPDRRRGAAGLPPAAERAGRPAGPPGTDAGGPRRVRAGGVAHPERAGATAAAATGGGDGRLGAGPEATGEDGPGCPCAGHRAALGGHGTGWPSSIVGAPATRVRKTVTAALPCGLGRTLRRSSSGATAEPRFFTVSVPTRRSRSRALSFLTLKGSRSVIS